MIVAFTVTVERTDDGMWEAQVGHRPAYSVVHKKPHKAVAKLVKMLEQEGLFDE